MSKNGRFWKQTMDKLDEKYVNETSEELFKHLGEKRELVEIHVDRPAEKKKGRGIWIGAAAALVCVIGGAAALRFTNVIPSGTKPHEGIEITLPAETTSAPDYAAAITLPKPEDKSLSAQNVDGTAFYESAFWGSWKSGGETIRFTYNEDPFEEDIIGAVVSCQTEGYFLQTYSGDWSEYKVERDTIYYIPADNLDIMYIYKSPESDDVKIYTRSGNETYEDCGAVIPKGRLNYIGRQKLALLMQIEDYEENFCYNEIMSTTLYDAGGSGLEILEENMILEDNVAWETTQAIKITTECRYNANASLAVNITLTLRRKANRWIIDYAKDTDGNIYTVNLMATNTELIDKTVTSGTFECTPENMALFEETFYGEWESESDTLSLTYTKDNQLPGWQRILSFAERDDGWYLTELGGGTGQVYFISKEEPEKMYYYMDFAGEDVPKNSYYCVYELKSRGSTVIRLGVISVLGMEKIQSIYGVNIWNIAPENITYDGVDYNRTNTDLYRGYGDAYVNELPTENKIVFSRRYFNTDSYNAMSDDMDMPEMKYFTFTVEKINGEWTITDTTAYVPLSVSDDYYVEYFRDKTGKYFALATFIAMNSHDTSALYFWDGTGYNKVADGFVNSRAVEIDGVVYILYYEKEDKTLRLRAYSEGNPYNDTLVCDMSGTEIVFSNNYSMRAVGDYIVIYYEEPGADTMRVSVYSKYLSCRIRTTEAYVGEISDTGFRMTSDGKEIVYTTDENNLEERLWHLNSSSSMLFSKIRVASPMIDSNDSFTQSGLTYYRVIEQPFTGYSSLQEFLHEIFTDNACYDIETEMFIDNSNFTTNTNYGYIYSADGARGSNIGVGDVTCSIKEQTDESAVLEYTVYGVDENFDVSSEVIETYEITAVNDGNGWRLDALYWPY